MDIAPTSNFDLKMADRLTLSSMLSCFSSEKRRWSPTDMLSSGRETSACGDMGVSATTNKRTMSQTHSKKTGRKRTKKNKRKNNTTTSTTTTKSVRVEAVKPGGSLLAATTNVDHGPSLSGSHRTATISSR